MNSQQPTTLPPMTDSRQPEGATAVGYMRLSDGKCPVCGKPNPRRHGEQFDTCSRKCGYAFRSLNSYEQIRASGLANIKQAIKKMKGSHGFGVCARDSKNHPNARKYRLRSPFGNVYEVSNLSAWCRKNEELFRPDQRQHNAQTPLWNRAIHGLTSVAGGSACSWFGWTAVCVFDIEGDPLARRVTMSRKVVGNDFDKRFESDARFEGSCGARQPE